MRAMLLTVTMIAALTSVGLASDGVIEINQARALAGGVTPGDAPGFPVIINQAGSYRLTSNLNVPAKQNGIDIGAAHVTIDLNGFAIVGNGSGTGIFSLTVDDTAIVNGVVTNFTFGIQAEGTGARVERVRVSSVAVGIDIRGIDALVSGCRVWNATGFGIEVGDGLVTGNLVSNSGTGLFLPGPVGYSGNSLKENTSNINGGVSLGANACDSQLCK